MARTVFQAHKSRDSKKDDPKWTVPLVPRRSWGGTKNIRVSKANSFETFGSNRWTKSKYFQLAGWKKLTSLQHKDAGVCIWMVKIRVGQVHDFSQIKPMDITLPLDTDIYTMIYLYLFESTDKGLLHKLGRCLGRRGQPHKSLTADEKTLAAIRGKSDMTRIRSKNLQYECWMPPLFTFCCFPGSLWWQKFVFFRFGTADAVTFDK